MKPITKIIILLAVVFTALKCSDSESITFSKEDFVGDWNINAAYKDGVAQTNWNGLVINIEQADDHSGIYRMDDTPNTLIWNKSGIWSKSENPNFFRRDDAQDVTFYFRNEELQLGLLVISDADTCENQPCILSVKGQWVFMLKKNE